jgi:hypothetical protein
VTKYIAYDKSDIQCFTAIFRVLTTSFLIIIIIIIIYISTQTQFKGTAAKALTWLQDGGSDKPVGMWLFDDEMKMNEF